jgi:hypothetical protein
VTIGVAEARERSMRGDPAWALPLERVRPSLGSAPRRVVLRDTWRPIATLYLVTAIAASIFGFLLPGLP